MYVSAIKDRIRQGDIFRNLEFRDAYNTSTGTITHAFAIVISQDCDLQQDFTARRSHALSQEVGFEPPEGKTTPNHDKFIPNAIVCPAFVAETLREGNHLQSINWTMQRLNKELWKPVKNNDSPRYHFLELSNDFGIPALVVDFKQTYSLPIEYLNKYLKLRAAKLDDLYAHDITLRHANYVSRVALPDDMEELF